MEEEVVDTEPVTLQEANEGEAKVEGEALPEAPPEGEPIKSIAVGVGAVEPLMVCVNVSVGVPVAVTQGMDMEGEMEEVWVEDWVREG